MKLWKIWQDVNQDYDAYDSAIVTAETEEEARMTHPRTTCTYDYWPMDTWTDPDKVRVEYLGEAKEGTTAGVILASYNAG